MTVQYLRINPNADLPELAPSPPFKVIVLADHVVTPEWQDKVSNHLVDAGCLYMMAWGVDCSSWDDAFDMVNVMKFIDQGIPEDKFLMTTWHDDETIEEVFHFCKFSAQHPTVELDRVLIFHISQQDASGDLISRYEMAG
ncbi:DUF7684 family protein [Undibacterium sp. Ji50W]|uniref:DUF7684 family protein n=1 Tax=Undibacterium sp. Ji50W TaxID=3413041 RepID=UPI003BF37AF4